jgi:hypothetical protein
LALDAEREAGWQAQSQEPQEQVKVKRVKKIKTKKGNEK